MSNPSSENRTVAITGANGYVGSTLHAAFVASGYRVIVLQRSAPAGDETTNYLPYSLENGPSQPVPNNLAAVVHCAYDMHARDRAEIERINLAGTEKLMQAVGDVPVVFISSMSAYTGTQQIYGQTKLACEALVSRNGGTSLRLGLVHGGTEGGMIGALRKVAALPLVPMLRPDSYQYTIHHDDMARCVISTVEKPPPHRVLGVANPSKLPFSELICALRAGATTKPLRPVPVTSAGLYRALCAAEAVGLRFDFRADSLLGLIHPAPDVPNVDHWAERAILLRDFSS